MFTKKAKHALILSSTLLACGIVAVLIISRLVTNKTSEGLQASKFSGISLSISTTSTPTTSETATPFSSLPPETAVFPDSADKGSDIVLVIDSSESMNVADPDGYYKAAAKLFISLLDTDDRVGVVGFGDAATLLSPLTQNTEQNRPALFNAVERISPREQSTNMQSTNIYEALLKGIDELGASSRSNRILIMMSGGRLDLGSKEKDDTALVGLKALLPQLVKAHIKLDTIAFTDSSDRIFLEHLALGTGGFFGSAKSGKDLHLVFFSTFEKIKSSDSVIVDGDSFSIDNDVREAIVLVSKKPGSAPALVNPSGNPETANRHPRQSAWYVSSVFDMVSIQNPAPGVWHIKPGLGEGNKVYVLTDLSLKSSFNRNFIPRGETVAVDAWLEKTGRVITGQSTIGFFSLTAEVTGPDGKTVDVSLAPASRQDEPQTGDGKFSGIITARDLGDYTVKILAQGKTFRREKTLLFKTIETSATGPVIAKAEYEKTAVPGLDHVHYRALSATPDEISWMSVLIRLGIVNLGAALLTALAVFIRMLALKMTVKRTKQ